MQETNVLLVALQTGAMTISMVMGAILVISRFQQPDTNKEYEQTRWLLVVAMLLLTIQYALQILYGFRAQGDDVGAVINILFYSPAAYILSYSSVALVGSKRIKKRYVQVSTLNMALILLCFAIGYYHYGSLHMDMAMKAMGVLFVVSLLFCVIYPSRQIKKIKKMVDEESGQMQIQFSIFLKTSNFLMLMLGLFVSLCIYYLPLLAIVGTLELFAILLFITSFITLGFNIHNVSQIINEEKEEEEEIKDANDNTYNKKEEKKRLNLEQREIIRQKLDLWRNNHGYSSSDINSALLAVPLGLSKRMLVQYIKEVEGKTFRIWLSDIRLEEAKRMIIEHGDYSNETIAEACGFSSRNYLQNKFKDATGLTPTEWRDANKNK